MAAPQCRGCKAVIRWITTRAGKAMPVDPDRLYEWVTDDARPGAPKVTLVADDGAMLTGWQARSRRERGRSRDLRRTGRRVRNANSSSGRRDGD